jgi:exosortase E/protease (VPEID-CTERM system)
VSLSSIDNSSVPAPINRTKHFTVNAALGADFSLLKSVLVRRFAFLGALLVLEWLPGRGGQSSAQWVAAFAALFFALTYLADRSLFQRVSRRLERIPIGWGYFAAHLCLLGAFRLLGMFRGVSLVPHGNFQPAWEGVFLAAAWLVAGALSVAMAALAFVPAGLWRDLLAGSYGILAGAAAAGVLAWQFIPELWSKGAGPFSRWVTGATFDLVVLLLRPFFTPVVTDRSIFAAGSERFMVRIGGACSGLEGIGLFLVFAIAWLWFCRRECRFPQALALIPAGVVVMWLLNGVRLAALILIGDAGAPKIALGGFHSQAGFLMFSGVALSVLFAADRVRWWSKREPAASFHEGVSRNPAAWYLTPFLAVLVAGMIAHAASSGFEWLYPLRLIAAAGALWVFRREYADLDWRFGWYAPLIGGAVFVLWLGLDPGHAAGADSLASGLAALPPFARIAWIVLRVLAAVVTVPIVEELAFRGFLIRRLIAADFTALNTRRYTLLAVAVSSVAFGLLHGDRWLAASIAGALYALVFLRRGRIGDAVIAHATSNALLAAWVLIGGKWYLW